MPFLLFILCIIFLILIKIISVKNVPKEQQLESGGDELAEVSWRHQQQPSYAPPISSAADPYSAAGRYI